MIKFWMDRYRIELFTAIFKNVVYLSLSIDSINSPYLNKYHTKGTCTFLMLKDVNICNNLLEKGFTI